MWGVSKEELKRRIESLERQREFDKEVNYCLLHEVEALKRYFGLEVERVPDQLRVVKVTRDVG